MEKICTYQKNVVPLHSKNKNKQQFKTITTMTKEELAQRIAQGEYTECQRDSKFSISFKIGDVKASVTKIGNSIVAMTVISTDISEDDYKRMLREALNNEMECLRREADAIRKEISDL